MSYFRASTDNPNGWRPGTVLLGNPASVQHRGPDWKAVAEQHEAHMRARRQRRDSDDRTRMDRAHAVDAAARGASLSGLGLNAINLNGQMLAGAPYVFHFSWGGLGIRPEMNAISTQIAADTNFANPVAVQESGGVQVSFIYNGRGSSVGDAGREMQNVINTFGLMGFINSLNFYAAEGGPATQQTASQPVTVTLPDGSTTIVSSVSAPGAPDAASSFNLTSFAAGLGTGGIAVAAIGALLLFKAVMD